MGSVHPLQTNTSEDAPPQPLEATIKQFEPRCALCGAKLTGHALRHQLVPPQSAHAAITVCHTCHTAALGEGYRPAV